MNRILLVLALVAFGCGQTPPSKPVDQQAIGKEMAAFRVACSYSQFLKIQNNQVKNLFEFECFPELDSYLNRLDQLDSVETLCTLTSLLLQLRKTQDNGTLPWMVYHSQRWVSQPGHSGWAEAARGIACFDIGEDLCSSTGWNSLSPWNQGQEFLTQGLKYADAMKNGERGWPLLDYYKRASTSAVDNNPILTA